MEAIGCLVPELQSEMHHGRETQVFEKTHCFYVVMYLSKVFGSQYWPPEVTSRSMNS